MNSTQFNRWKQFAHAMCFSLSATEQRKEKLWWKVESFIDDHRAEPVDGWDNDYCLCDSFCEWFYEYGTDIFVESGKGRGSYYKESPHYFYNQLQIIIRASIDVVFGGCGVLGYTAGDVRRMFNGRVPRWVSWRYKQFSRIPDSALIWL